ncbi:MAG: hypothetical protein HY268_16210 [Deltaproteobacteria bacterium]|nr:hypothetical protein [Deltaproteobacteria bacterium]
MFVLDTDAMTYDQNAHPLLSGKVKSTPREHLFIASITIEEQLKGRLAYISKHRNDLHKSAYGQAALVQTVYYFSKWNILLFNTEAGGIFRQL